MTMETERTRDTRNRYTSWSEIVLRIVTINEEKIASIRHSDNVALLATLEHKLQNMVENVSTVREEYGPSINIYSYNSLST